MAGPWPSSVAVPRPQGWLLRSASAAVPTRFLRSVAIRAPCPTILRLLVMRHMSVDSRAGGLSCDEWRKPFWLKCERGARGGRRTSGESHRADGRGRASASWSQRREGLEPSTGQTDGPSDQTRRPTDNARRPSVQDRPLNLQPPKTPETADKTPNNLTDGTMMGFFSCRRPLSHGKALKCLDMRAGARCKPPALQE